MTEATDRIEHNAALTRQDAADKELQTATFRLERAVMMAQPSFVLRAVLAENPAASPELRWRASYYGLQAYGPSPEAAFSAFDIAWRTKAEGPRP
jgi:hypothetical protein